MKQLIKLVFSMLYVVGSFAVAGPANAALTGVAAERMQKMFRDTGATGMVVAIVNANDLTVDGYGHARADGGAVPDANSLVRIGSLSKLLADDLLTKLVMQGKLKLSDELLQFDTQNVGNSEWRADRKSVV